MKNKKEKQGKKSSTWIRLIKYLLDYKVTMVFIVIFILLSNYLFIVAPALSGQAIDVIKDSNGQDIETVLKLCLQMAVMYIIGAILTYYTSLMFTSVGQKVAFKLRKQSFEKILSLSTKSLEKYQSGEVISRLTYDINLISTSITTDFVQVITATVTIIGAIIMMISISPILFGIFFLVVPVSAIYTKILSARIRPLFRARSKAVGGLCRYIDEKVTGTKTVRAYCAEEFYCEDFKKVNGETCDTQYKADYKASIMMPMNTVISNTAIAIIVFFGIILNMANMMTFGNISNFIIYSRRFLNSINEYSNIVSDLQSALAASERIFSILDEEIEVDAKEEIKTEFKGDIDIENVDFNYVENVPVLKNISMKVKQGQTIAVVGETGSGKTTLISLLMRFYDVNSGSIKIDGINIEDIPRKQVRKCFAMVLQNSWIFYDTVYNNIAYGNPDVTFDEVVQAAKSARVHDIIMSMPNGYQTILSENAVNLSKGQKQLIAIARAMVQKSKMVILDEATSNVDTDTEQRIHLAMKKLREGKTSFMIAHRLSTIKDADVIVVLIHGEIVEQGTHQELMDKDGEYARIYKSQFI